jgi:hypothetical protein
MSTAGPRSVATSGRPFAADGASPAVPTRTPPVLGRLVSPEQPASLLPQLRRREQNETMRQVAVVLYVLALVAVVVGMDILFFKDHFWERLIVNVGIVLVFLAFGLRFLRNR